MGAVGQWLQDNWLALAGLVIGIVISYRLRPHPSLRCTVDKDGSGPIVGNWSVFNGTTTRLRLRNSGTETLSPELFRQPLAAHFPTACKSAELTGVSHPDISGSTSIASANPRWVLLVFRHLEPGDELEYSVEHEPTRLFPRVVGELRGRRGAIDRRFPVYQSLCTRFSGGFVAFFGEYIAIAPMYWALEALANSRGLVWVVILIASSGFGQMAVNEVYYSKVKRTYASTPPEERASKALLAGCLLLPVVTSLFAIGSIVAISMDLPWLVPSLAAWSLVIGLIIAATPAINTSTSTWRRWRRLLPTSMLLAEIVAATGVFWDWSTATMLIMISILLIGPRLFLMVIDDTRGGPMRARMFGRRLNPPTSRQPAAIVPANRMPHQLLWPFPAR